ncbi:MFS transporter, partial [Streptomyces lydicus]
MTPSAAAGAAASAVPLPHVRRDVRLFWWAGTCDALGSQVSGLVLPLLLLSLGWSPAEVGVVAGLSTGSRRPRGR